MAQSLFARFNEFTFRRGMEFASENPDLYRHQNWSKGFLRAPAVGKEFLELVSAHPEWVSTAMDRMCVYFLKLTIRPYTEAEMKAFDKLFETLDQQTLYLAVYPAPMREYAQWAATLVKRACFASTVTSYQTTKHVVKQLLA